MSNRFYVYLHKRNDTGKIFYIGKGTGNRAWLKDSRKTKAWKDIVNTYGYSVEIFKDNLSEDYAEKIEVDLINDPEISSGLVNVTTKSTGIKTMEYQLFKDIFYYDETSPSCLRWSVNRYRKMRAGDVAGSLKIKKDGSPHNWVVCVNNKMYCVHRIIYILHNSDFNQKLLINHLNCDSSNNLISNLEAVTKQENNSRQKMHVLDKPRTDNKTGVTGVYLTKNGYYRATAVINGIALQENFSVIKLGKDLAFEMAVAWRKETLNLI